MREERRARLSALFETCYLVMVGVVALMAFNYSTMSGIVFPAWLHRGVLLLTALIAVGRYLTAEKLDPRQAAAALAVVVLFYIAGKNANQRLGELALLIVGARGIRFEKILKVHLICIFSALVVTIVLSLTGVIENLIYARVREGGDTVYFRNSFGIASPTDFGAHVFFAACSYAWLRARRISWAELAVVFAAALWLYHLSDARCDVACLVLLAAGLAYVKVRRLQAQKRGKTYRMARGASFALAGAAVGAALLSLLAAFLYTEDSPAMVWLNRLLTKRLELSHEAVTRYPVTLLGQIVKMNGWGGDTAFHDGYFWIDCSYLYTLLLYGAIVLAIVVAIQTAAGFRQRKLGNWERLGILALVAVQCMVEHHLTEIGYNPFLLLAFALCVPEPEEPPETA